MVEYTPKSYEDFDPERRLSVVEAAIPVAGMIGFLAVGIIHLGLDPQMPLLFAIAFTGVIAKYHWGYSWDELYEGISNSILMGLSAIFILFIIYMLISAWINAGTIPWIMYWGLEFMTPKIFLPFAAILSFIVAFSIGSSWTTAGSLGIALVGIGAGLNIPEPMTAGAILSGVYMGDKQSPLSDTTLLASGTTNTDLMEHVYAMLPGTIIVGVVSIVVYGALGLQAGGSVPTGQIAEIQGALSGTYALTPLVLLPMIITFALALYGYPALPSLSAGIFAGAGIAIFTQGVGFSAAWNAIHYGTGPETGVEMVTGLLSSGGLNGSIWTVTIVFAALSLGGLLEVTGILATIAHGVSQAVSSIAGVTAATAAGPITLNLLTGDQYMAIVVPGMTFRDLYDEYDLESKNLSRALEASGTVTSAMIPWNSGGVFMASALGVSTVAYAPYYIVGYLSPIVLVLMGITGWNIYRKEPTPADGEPTPEGTSASQKSVPAGGDQPTPEVSDSSDMSVPAGED